MFRRVVRKLSGNRAAPHVAYVEKFLVERNPSLVVISNGCALPPLYLVELCIKRQQPFVTIAQANHDGLWPHDDAAQLYRKALPAALRCYFVSDANRRMTEKQIGTELANAEVVRNPFNVPFDMKPMWPSPSSNGELRFACVARLHPPSKGQDMLFEALSTPLWSERNWRLTLYGDGPYREGLARLAGRLGLGTKVRFAGHVDDIVGIWSKHNLLVLPSRYEGMPLALIEAMLCGRPVITTHVAGHAEVLEDGVTGFLAEAPTVPAILHALERAWQRRSELQDMGAIAARRIREFVPSDPVGVFADKLTALAVRPSDSVLEN